MGHIHTHDHGLVLVDDTESCVVDQLINTAKLEIELERDIGKVLLLSLGEFRTHHADCMDAEFDIANVLDSIIQECVCDW